MKYKALILCAILALTECSLTPQKAPICNYGDANLSYKQNAP